MRADIHDGPEHMLQSEAGYIDVRPLTPARQNLLQRTAGPYIRVKVRRTQHEHMFSGLPLKADIARCSWHVANVPKHKVAALQPAARGQEPRGRKPVERTALAGLRAPS